MKNLIPVLSILFCFAGTIPAQDSIDISRSLAGEKLVTSKDFDGGKMAAFWTKQSFDDLKKTLLKFLGEDWQESKVESKVEKATSKALATQGQDLKGITSFKKGTETVTLTLVGEEEETIANVALIRGK